MSKEKTAHHQARIHWKRVTRILLPIFLVWVGVVSIIYGGLVHARPVLVEQELVVPPSLVEAGPFAQFRALPGQSPQGVRKRIVAIRQLEADLIREVTVGGVVRLQSGEIKRTYTGDAPSGCPT